MPLDRAFAAVLAHYRFLRDSRSVAQPAPVDPAEWREQTVPDLAAAEDLLDSLEAAGVTEAELVIRGSAFAVRWRG